MNDCDTINTMGGLFKRKGLTIYEFYVKTLVKWSGKEDNYNV